MPQINYNTTIFEAAFGTPSQFIESDVPEIVFSGRSNVGKSSLLNKIFNRKSLARVSSEPGKTATINFYRASDIRFVDLPGYGFAKKTAGEKRRWSDLIETYFRTDRNIKLIVQLLDMRHAPSEDDKMMLDFMQQLDFPFIVVLTKCDKLKVNARKQQKESLLEHLNFIDPASIIEVSAVTGEGVPTLHQIFEEIKSTNNEQGTANNLAVNNEQRTENN